MIAPMNRGLDVSRELATINKYLAAGGDKYQAEFNSAYRVLYVMNAAGHLGYLNIQEKLDALLPYLTTIKEN